MFTNTKRITVLLLISVCMNIGLFLLAYFLNIPLWLDTTGTIYISCLAGAPLGYISAIILNVFEAVFFWGSGSLIYYLVSMLTALFAAYIFKKYNDRRFGKWIIMILVLIIIGSISSVLLTFWVDGGVPSNYWSNFLYYQFLQNNVNHIISTISSVLIIKIPDVIISVLIAILAIRITPEKYKTMKMVIFKEWESTDED